MSIQAQHELPFWNVPDADFGLSSREPGLHHSDEQKIIDQAFEILTRRHQRGEVLSSPENTKAFLRLRLCDRYNEVFGCIFLDNRHRVIEIEDIFFGTIDGATVHPRVVVQIALSHNASAVIAYHNHPSGVAEPSKADATITHRIRDALLLIDVRLIDHLVVSTEGSVSLAERGLL